MPALESDYGVVPLQEDDLAELIIVDLGPAGIIPLDAGFNTIHILSQRIVVYSGMLIIDRMLGEYVVAVLSSNVTMFEINNWPLAPYLGRIVLEVQSTGDYDIQWPSWISWSRNRIPSISAGGNDVFLFTSIDEGQTVKGSIVGQDYPQL